jgi:hypothetical protein
MNELEIFKQIAEGLGIGATMIIASTWLLTKAIHAYQANTKERNLIELERLKNERAERESSYKEKFEFAQATRDLGTKSQSLADTIEKVFERLKDDNGKAIDATKTAENNVLTALNQAYEKHATEIEKLGRLIGELYTISKERATPDDVRNTINEILPLVETALSKIETRVVSEITKLKITESGRITLSAIQQASKPAQADSFDANTNTTGDTL